MIIRRQRLYSSLEQREFARWTRPFKRAIGRIRSNIAEKLTESGMKSVKDGEFKSITEGSRSKTISNPQLTDKILNNEIPKGIAVSRNSSIANNGGGGVFVRKGNVSKAALDNPTVPDHEKKFIKDILAGEGGIAVKENLGAEVLAHEVGHAKNATGRGLKRKISELDPRNDPMGAFGGNVHVYPGAKNQYRPWGMEPGKVSTKEAIKDLGRDTVNSGKILAEEINANKEAIKVLKKQGASKKEIKEAKKLLNNNIATYRGMAKGSLKSGIGRIINIPSRRGVGQSLV